MQGVVGAYSRVDAVRKALYILYGVQHRGQESAGLSAAGDHSLRTWKERGLVSKVFVDRFPSFIHPDDYVVIGCASGENADNEIAPIGLETGRYHISLTFDGYVPDRGSGTNEEAFAEVLQGKLDGGLGIEEALSGTMADMPMAYYCLVMAAMVISAGAMIMVHVNDSFFWVVTGFSKMDVAAGYRTVSVLSAVMGVTAFAVISLMGPFILGL